MRPREVKTCQKAIMPNIPAENLKPLPSFWANKKEIMIEGALIAFSQVEAQQVLQELISDLPKNYAVVYKFIDSVTVSEYHYRINCVVTICD